MRHSIDPEQHGRHGQVMADAVQSCVHCGFCLAACPTYHVLGEEMDSPRGRIYLMKQVLENQTEASEAQPYIDRCLGCNACVPACPSGVEYGDLLHAYRAATEPAKQRTLADAAARAMIVETLPYPKRFRAAAQGAKLGKLTQRFLPDKVGAMIGLVPDSLPPARPLPAVFPAIGRKRARVALLAGCVQQVLAPDINWATLRVLAANGVETVIPAGQGCCGSIMMHIGETERAQALARTNLDHFPTDVDAIITNAAGCGSGMHEYGLLFAGEAEEARATEFAGLVCDVAQFLDQLGFVAPSGPATPLRVAYQDACHLIHAQGVATAPRALLAAIPNVELVPIAAAGLCCGSAGTYNIEQPEIANELGQRKADTIIATDADVVLSGNIGCLTQIQTHLVRKNRPIPLMHTIEFIDQYY